MNQVTDIIFFWFPVLLTFPMVEHLKAIIYHMVPKGDCCYIINGKEEEVNHSFTRYHKPNCQQVPAYSNHT